MSKKNIVIVGFPKSGTTWASRLVAELIQCPLIGDWGYEHLEALYRDGIDRKSEFQCFKSHHTFKEINSISSQEIYKIIYLIRDPRDIVISGVHYFDFSMTRFKLLHYVKPYFVKRIFLTVFNSTISKQTKKKMMIKAVLKGYSKLNQWFKTSWSEHHTGYQNKDILFVKYENLLDTPEEQCHKILDYLQITSSKQHIKKSIKNQSFIKMKEEVSHQNNDSLKKLIRKGSQGYWKKEFSPKELEIFKQTSDNPFYKL